MKHQFGTKSSTQERYEKLDRQLARLQSERTTKLEALEKDIERARNNGASKLSLAEMQKRLADYDGLNQRAIQLVETERDQAKAILDQEESKRQEAAQAQIDALKAQARNAWVSQGGSSKDFETAWPGMQNQILTKRVMDALEN